MKFKSLALEGFRTYAALQTFQLERPAGVYLITGANEVDPDLESNGIGKSTMPGDAISWAMFGRTTRGVFGPSVVSWFPHDRCYVKVDFEETRIERAQSPNSLLANGVATTTEDIVRFFGIDLDRALVCLILGQMSISFLEQTPKAKLEMLSTVLGLDLWERCSDTASVKNDELTIQINKLEAKEQSLKDQMTHLTESINQLQAKQSQFDEEQKNSAKILKSKMSELSFHLSELAEQQQAVFNNLNSAESELKELKDTLDKEADDLDKLKEQAGRIALEKQALKSKRDQLTSEYQKWNELSGNCPYCNQPISNETIRKTKAELAKQRSATRPEWERLGKECDDTQRAITERFDSVRDGTSRIRSMSESVVQLREANEILGRRLVEERVTLDNLKRDLEKSETQTNPFLETLAEQQTLLNQLEGEDESIQLKIGDLTADQKSVSWWVKGFKDLRLWITKLALETLTTVANQTLSRLGLRNWSLEFDIERTTGKGTISRGLNVLVNNQLTDERQPIEVWSGGELQRLKLATTWGLAYLVESYSGFRSNILILDEPSQFLSPAGLNQLLEFLHDEANQTKKAIYVIDHHSLESPYFDGIINLVKRNDGTTICDN